MPDIRLDHFVRAAADIGAHGDNDMLPFDIDTSLVKDNQEALSKLGFAFCQELSRLDKKAAKNSVDSLPVFSERLLVSAGPAGFRVATAIHPFWSIYFDGLGVALAEALEPRRARLATGCAAVEPAVIGASALQHAMLFELAVAAAEQILTTGSPDWDTCLAVAIERQRRHFDAKVPAVLSETDKNAALAVAQNLVTMLNQLQAESGGEQLVHSPEIPGYQWIASGVGDFSLGARLIEVKCTNKLFSSSDYRQIVMYWLLAFAASVKTGSEEWRQCILLNPRLNCIVQLPFDEIIDVFGAGRSKIDLLEMFSSIVGDRAM